MKNITYYLRFLTLALCFFIAACSDDDKEPTKPVFPELQKIEGVVGQTATIEFEAASEWRLTSSALWCKFIVDGELVNSCSGGSGAQKVTISITDDATEVTKSYKAQISLFMKGYQEVIYEVIRPTTGYEIALLDEEGNPYTTENPCVIPYDTYPSYKVRANFDWKLKSWPEWLESTSSSDVAGEVSTNSISGKIQKGYTKYAATGLLVFVNEAGEEVATFPISYSGIPADRIEFSISPWNWTFSTDGLTYTAGGTSDAEAQDSPLTFSVVAKDDNYKVIALTSEDYVYSHAGAYNWYSVADDSKGTIKISAEPNEGKVRNGCLMIFPMAVYNEIGDDKFDEVVLPGGEMAYGYEKYMAIEFKQSGVARGFTVKDAEYNELPTISLKDEGYTDMYLTEMYGTTNVYRLELYGAAEMLSANASGFSEMYCMVDTQFSEDSEGWGDAFAQSAWSGGNFNIMDIPATAKGQMIITVQDGNGMTFGVLLVQQMGGTYAIKKNIRK